MKRWLSIFVMCLGLLCCHVYASAQTAPDYDALVYQGNTQLQAGSNDLALATAQSAIKLNTDRWEAYALAGGALMNLKRYEEAADDFSKAIEHAPETKQQGLRDLRKQCLLAESGVAPTTVQPSVSPTTQPAGATTQAEIVLWKSIENNANPVDFKSYLDQYPNGAFAVLAKRHLAEIQAQAEAAQWKAIENSNNPDDFRSFLKQYPDTPFVPQAQSHLVDAEKAQSERVAQEQHLAVWVDPDTSIMWTKSDNGSPVDPQQAASYCKGLKLAGFSDWRLPTLNELREITDKSQQVDEGGWKAHIKGGIKLTGREWGTNPNGTSGQDLDFSFNCGHFGLTNPCALGGQNDPKYVRVLCVRDAER